MGIAGLTGDLTCLKNKYLAGGIGVTLCGELDSGISVYFFLMATAFMRCVYL